jgi:hypothetical protein
MSRSVQSSKAPVVIFGGHDVSPAFTATKAWVQTADSVRPAIKLDEDKTLTLHHEMRKKTSGCGGFFR